MSCLMLTTIKLRLESMKQNISFKVLQHYRQKLKKQVKKTDTSIRTKKDKWVREDLSKHTLTEDESKVLARGLNFAVSSNVIPKQQILAEIEKGIQKLPEHSANLFRKSLVF